MEELGRRRLQGASGFSTRRKSQYLCRVWPVGVFKRNAKVTGLKSCGGCREVKIQKSKATAITTQRCATVRNRRNWTIIIKYHHLSQLKAFGNHFFFSSSSPHKSLFLRLGSSAAHPSPNSVETVEQIRVEYKQAVFGGAGGTGWLQGCKIPGIYSQMEIYMGSKRNLTLKKRGLNIIFNKTKPVLCSLRVNQCCFGPGFIKVLF